MRIPAWGPEYSLKELMLSREKKKVRLKLGEEEYFCSPDEIGIAVVGMVKTFNESSGLADYSTTGAVTRGTLELLDVLGELEVPNLYIVKYNELEKGKELIKELKEFEDGAKVYQTSCVNPAVDTQIVDDLKPLKVLFVTGLNAHTNIMQFVNTLKAEKDSGKIKLEKLLLPDACVGIVNKIANFDELNFWAKYYMSEYSGAELVEVYRGETRIA